MIRTVRTENGTVRGIEAADPRITAFKGIPFAAPATGENRWRAPQPCKDWEGVLDAFRFGPIAMQYTPGGGDYIYNYEWHVDPQIEMSEDCLQLNIWTGAMSAEEKRPVYVWFYGGALQCGYPAEMEFDGERLARRGIVVVTVNYRVNVFGFLAHPEITREAPDAPANFGHLDQQAGLKWVIRNIEGFGGDPENITIGGQSAGGGSVMYQMTCMENEGRFQHAIIESGVIGNPYGDGAVFKPTTLAEAEHMGEEFFRFVGAKSLAEARSMDAAVLFEKYAAFGKMMGTVQDNKFCMGDSYTRFMQNQFIHVPIMAGNTSDEFPNCINAPTDAQLKAQAEELFGEHAAQFMKLPEVQYKDYRGNRGKVIGIEPAVKSMFLENEKNGNGTDCYYYRFDANIPGDDHPVNFHSVDLWFFFETLAKCWRPFTGRHYDLSRQMCNYWTNFIKCGDPNGVDADGTQMPHWAPYKEKERCGMVLSDDGIRAEETDSPIVDFLVGEIRDRY